MRNGITTIIVVLTLLNSGIGLAQSKKPSSGALVARLSYTSTYGVNWEEQGASPKVCFALYRSGHFQILTDTEKGTEFLQGILPRDQVLHVSMMLEHLDFKSSDASLVRQGAESFEAEVFRDGGTTHYVWVDPDHKRPFPASAISVVHWLQNFKAKDATPLALREFSQQQVCPLGRSPLPLSAGLIHESGTASCGRR